MTPVPLTNSHLTAIIDGERAEEVLSRKWYMVTNRNTNYACTCKDNTSVYMHHFLFGRGMFDHKDGNGLNNSQENVRRCNFSLNSANCKKKSGTSSKFKGVSWDKRRGTWQAAIMKNKKRQFLGSFHIEADAANAYDEAAIKTFGEFARLNNAALIAVKGEK